MIDVITIYRSKQGQHDTLKTKLMHLLTGDKTTLVVGDFNFCFKEESTPIKSFLAAGNFKQLVNEPTHNIQMKHPNNMSLLGGHGLHPQVCSTSRFCIKISTINQGWI